MADKKIKETKFYSFKKGNLAKGCVRCVKGKKSVLFITGVCPRNCFFCPTSEKKKNNDVRFINERQYTKDEELIDEIKLSKSKGVGITGGDPLARFSRTIDAIKLLKNTFGKKFHIHLYTSLNLVNERRLKELNDAGLDEIRFHPDLDDESFWNKIKLAKKLKWDVGIEIPVIPDKEEVSKKLINEYKDYVDFINLNELEISDLNAQEFQDRHYDLVDEISYAVKGSRELAFELMALSNRAHFCTCSLKDAVQLTNRIKLRAKSVAQKYDHVDDDGMLIRGAIYHNAMPDRSYKEVLKGLDTKKEIKYLNQLRDEIISEFKIPKKLIVVDEKKLRLLTTAGAVESLKDHIDNKCAVVMEYPTYDNMEVEIDFLN